MSSIASSNNTQETGSGIRYDQFTNEISEHDCNQSNQFGAYFTSKYCDTYYHKQLYYLEIPTILMREEDRDQSGYPEVCA